MNSIFTKLDKLVSHYDKKDYPIRVGQMICSALDRKARDSSMITQFYDFMFLLNDKEFEIELDKLIAKTIDKDDKNV